MRDKAHSGEGQEAPTLLSQHSPRAEPLPQGRQHQGQWGPFQPSLAVNILCHCVHLTAPVSAPQLTPTLLVLALTLGPGGKRR